ncbi:MAG TPA: hypothetical protein VMX55_13680 [candidate division Zixibacteria bacterium]|nr:hypothetical protein [candidate division Zixibacteria bacterium]
MTNKLFKILSSKDVKQALPMQQAIETMKEAFIQLTENKAVIPPRIHLGIPEFNGDSLIMPVFIPNVEKIGLKVINLFNDNPKKNLPLIHALVLIFDSTNGCPIAMMNGSYLTALRTGAGSGLATDLLANKDSKIVSIFGAGQQGRTQLEAVCSVRQIRKAFIYDTNKKRAKEFAEEMSDKLSIPILLSESAQELKEADIICTATNSLTPVFSDNNIKSGVHINAIGSYKPNIREIPSETIRRSKIFVDHKESCLSEAGDLIIPIKEGIITKNNIIAELGELLTKDTYFRKTKNDITLYKSVGNAVQDIITANQILINAQKLNLGIKISL